MPELQLSILLAIAKINEWRPKGSCNNSQVAAYVVYPRTSVAKELFILQGQGFIRNIGKGAAYRWRLTDKGKATVKAAQQVAKAVVHTIGA